MPVYGTGEEQQSSIIASCDSLTKLLRSAIASSDELPLAITSVHGVSPAFRFAEVTILHWVLRKMAIMMHYTHTQPFYSSLDSVRDYPGKPVPER